MKANNNCVYDISLSLLLLIFRPLLQPVSTFCPRLLHTRVDSGSTRIQSGVNNILVDDWASGGLLGAYTCGGCFLRGGL